TTWLDWLEAFHVTVSWAPHSAYARLADPAIDLAAAGRDLRRVRALLNGGEPIGARQARAFLRALAPAGLRDDAMWPAWGMSETCSAVTLSESFGGTGDDEEVDLGRPIDGVEIRIVDDDGRPVPDGQVGALLVHGDCVTIGYFGDAEATTATFTDGRWLRTGDVGRLVDGRLRLSGRARDTLIVNGRNIACVEVEAAAESVEGVIASSAGAITVADGPPVLV